MVAMSHRTPISTAGAPAAIGPYSQAILHENLVFCSGQIGLDPKSQAMVEGGVEAEAHRALENLAAVLTQAGTSLSRALRLTVYLIDMADFAKINTVYAEFFRDGAPPARAAVAVAALPKGARVEIDCIAAMP
jgi:reactive intermediate/imine deaminase